MTDKALMEQFQMLAGMMEKMATKEELKSLESRMLTKDDIEPLTDRAASKAAALVEERLGKRIDVLTDGYKLTHEKQWELEKRMETLERELAEIKSKIA